MTAVEERLSGIDYETYTNHPAPFAFCIFDKHVLQDGNLSMHFQLAELEVPMIIRLLIVEPDEELLDSHVQYFNRLAEFKTDSAIDSDGFVKRLELFLPHILMLEPEICGGIDILNRVEIPVIVLSRFTGDAVLRSHRAITEYYVKPKSLVEICDTLKRLVSTADPR